MLALGSGPMGKSQEDWPVLNGLLRLLGKDKGGHLHSQPPLHNYSKVSCGYLIVGLASSRVRVEGQLCEREHLRSFDSSVETGL